MGTKNARAMILPRRIFIKGLVGPIAAPAVVRAEVLMPICVWKPTFHRCGNTHSVPYLLACKESDLIGVDLASLGLPPPLTSIRGNYQYWPYSRFPLESLPREKVRIPLWQQAELELSGSASCAAF
jgi:hypothetical protein